jgi:hypothetical protein
MHTTEDSRGVSPCHFPVTLLKKPRNMEFHLPRGRSCPKRWVSYQGNRTLLAPLGPDTWSWG